MNTTAKGDIFEKASLQIIYNAIEEKRIGLMSDLVKIFEKKQYYSRDRNGNIVFDLAIELWPPEALNYSLLYLIECKNYSSSVPVNDVEEFYSKICQVAGVNVKGVFITNKGFQESAYNFAKSKGMMLIVGQSKDDYNIVLYRSNRPDFPFISMDSNRILVGSKIPELEKLIEDTIRQSINLSSSDNDSNDFQLQYLSRHDIELKVNEILNSINPRILRDGDKLFKLAITDHIKNNYNFKVDNLYNQDKILGSCDFSNSQILINSKIIDTPRHSFVLAHEFGHLVLHKGLKIGQETYNNFEDSVYNITTGKHELKNARNWIEWQANYFATCLLLPKAVLKAYLTSFSGSNGPLYLDDQRVNIHHFNEVITKLANRFSVTKTSIIMRLKELNQIVNNSNLKSIGQIIGENIDDLFM